MRQFVSTICIISEFECEEMAGKTHLWSVCLWGRWGAACLRLSHPCMRARVFSGCSALSSSPARYLLSSHIYDVSRDVDMSRDVNVTCRWLTPLVVVRVGPWGDLFLLGLHLWCLMRWSWVVVDREVFFVVFRCHDPVWHSSESSFEAPESLICDVYLTSVNMTSVTPHNSPSDVTRVILTFRLRRFLWYAGTADITSSTFYNHNYNVVDVHQHTKTHVIKSLTSPCIDDSDLRGVQLFCEELSEM